MRIHLRDINPALVAAWATQFKHADNVVVSEGDIFDAGPHDAIVSPANSFGVMDGGIDLAYSRHFGWELQTVLQQRIRDRHDGELLVGAATIVRTDNADIPWLVSAPTMRVPSRVHDTVNAYLAFRAVLLAVRAHNATDEAPIRSLLCPGLGTAVGAMPPTRCAYQMHAALLAVSGELPSSLLLGQARELHISMLTS